MIVTFGQRTKKPRFFLPKFYVSAEQVANNLFFFGWRCGRRFLELVVVLQERGEQMNNYIKKLNAT
jgi:hypothetical protein